MKEFDEQELVAFINSRLEANDIAPYPEDEILNVVDMIWDYYEQNGLLDIDADDDEACDENILEDVVAYAERMLKKDKGSNVDPAHLPLIVEAEFDYEDSLDDSI